MVSYGEAEHNVKNHKFDMQLNSIDHLFKAQPAIAAERIKLPENIDKMIETGGCPLPGPPASPCGYVQCRR